MPCTVDPLILDDEEMQHKDAAQLLIHLYKHRNEPVPERLPAVATAFYRGYREVQDLCEKIRACGGMDYLQREMEAHPTSVELADIYGWFVRHEAHDRAREARKKADEQARIRREKERKAQAAFNEMFVNV